MMNKVSHVLFLLFGFTVCTPVKAFDIDSVYSVRLHKIEKNIPFELNDDVRSAIRNRVENFSASEDLLARSQEFMPGIEKELWQNNIPSEFKYLPIATSNLNPINMDADGGIGLWELQYITARKYGLTVNDYVDERRDAIKSTRVALRYINDLHNLYQSWPLSLLAFVSSPSDVNAAMNRAGTQTNIWAIYASIDDPGKKDFAEFVAAAYLMNYFGDHGIQKRTPGKPQQCKSFQVERNLDITELCSRLGIQETELRRLNPLLRGTVVPSGMNIQLNIPNYLAERFEAIKDTLSVPKPTGTNVEVVRNFYFDETNYKNNPTVTTNSNIVKNSGTNTTTVEKSYHKVVSGESLGRIAGKYHVSVDQLKRWNNLKSDMIYAGQRLVIQREVKTSVPTTTSNSNTTTTEVKPTETTTSTPPPTTTTTPKQPVKTTNAWVTHRVRSGDSVWKIATRYGVSETDIRKNNKLDGNLIHPGQVLKIKKS